MKSLIGLYLIAVVIVIVIILIFVTVHAGHYPPVTR